MTLMVCSRSLTLIGPGASLVSRCPEMWSAPGRQMAFVVFGAQGSTVGRRGGQRPQSHHGTPNYCCPRRCRRARSRSPGGRNRHWTERRVPGSFTPQLLLHRHFGHHAARLDNHLLHHEIDDRGLHSRRPVLCTEINTTRASYDAHGGMCDKGRHGDWHHVERLGSQRRGSGYRHRQGGFPECSGDRGCVPSGGWDLSGLDGHPLERRDIGSSDYDVDDSTDHTFGHSANDDYDDRWDSSGCGVATGFRMGRELRASSRRSRSRRTVANQRRSPTHPGPSRSSGSAHSHRHNASQRLRGAQRTSRSSAAPGNVRVFTIHRSIVVRLGVAAAVLAALGVGFFAGLAISSPPSRTSGGKVVTDASVASVKSPSLTTKASPPAASSAKLPTVLSCTPGSKPQVRPETLDIGCAGDISMSGVTWSTWGSTGYGSGMLTANNCQPSCAAGTLSSSPAFVVLSKPLGGVFQDVLITPPAGALTAQSSSRPGSGWGSG